MLFAYLRMWEGDLPDGGSPFRVPGKGLRRRPHQSLCVNRSQPIRMRCIATDIRPVTEVCPSPDALKDGLDYIAIGCEDAWQGQPMLGIAQSYDDTSAYALLLRGLACITELATTTRIELLNTQWLAGALISAPAFELHLILTEPIAPSTPEATLCEFARDLAEVARQGIQEEHQLGQRMTTVRCLQMDPSNFSGSFEELWSI